MRQLFLRPLLGFALLAAQPLLAGAAQAQDFDDDLVDCLALSYIALNQAEVDAPTAPDNRVAELVALLESVSAGLSHMVADGSGCTGSLDDMVSIVNTSRDQFVEAYGAHLAVSGDHVASYAEVIFLPLRACTNDIGQAQIEAANADRLANGYACGWGQ